MKDYILRFVKGRGYLPIINDNGIEIYRGEYQKTALEALDRCINKQKEMGQA